MICTNWVRRRMRYLQWFRVQVVVTQVGFELHRHNGTFVVVELSEVERAQFVRALGGAYQGNFLQEENNAER